MSRIFWDEDEREKVAYHFWLVSCKEPFSSVIEKINTAQGLCLPADRQREVGSVQSVPWLGDMVAKYMTIKPAFGEDNVKEQVQKIKAVADEGQKQYQEVIDGLRRELEKLQEEHQIEIELLIEDHLAKMSRALEELPVEILVSELTKRAKIFIPFLLGQLQPQAVEVPVTVSEPVRDAPVVSHPVSKPAKVKKTKLLLIGLRGSQTDQIKSSFPDHDLDFIDTDKAPGLDRFPKCDRAFVMAGQISHKVTDKVKIHLDSSRVVLHYGGVSGLIKKMQEVA